MPTGCSRAQRPAPSLRPPSETLGNWLACTGMYCPWRAVALRSRRSLIRGPGAAPPLGDGGVESARVGGEGGGGQYRRISSLPSLN